ncbi:HD-GYP domain-containing protein [Alienimonas californiensis]|uniref:HD-GYP domain-containing protein n=1 Tax=Alienimonas californiensis TaxID=2527989 RepID=UPI00119E6A5A|nr:HD-GYP domain-containing protein [Alienimonas californiensis]
MPAALSAHAGRTGLNLALHLTDPGVPHALAVREVAPGVLGVNLPLPEAGPDAAAAGLLPIAGGVAGEPADAVARLLALSGAQVAAQRRADGQQASLEDLTEQLSRCYEELALYHRLTGLMQITRDPAAFARECVTQTRSSTGVDAAAILLEGEDAGLLSDGLPLFNDVRVDRITRAAENHDWTRPLVLNGPACTLRGAASVAFAPVRQGSTHYGWIACGNGLDGEELGSVEGSLLQVVATVLATHLRNQGLFREKEQMMLEFVLGLVQTLDARDRYTRGHSERVAVVAHRLARQLGLKPAELDNIYLSGLLHDIGKVGIDDGVLRKPGKLTDQEFDQIKRHPVIGYDILVGISGLSEILPGVRSHHENYDGTGYPDQLAGTDIPEMARIMAVADAYDAMGSDRPYRDGMPVERIEKIFREGRGTQWDAEVMDAYFACSEEVRTIWSSPNDSAARLAARAKRRISGSSSGR